MFSPRNQLELLFVLIKYKNNVDKKNITSTKPVLLRIESIALVNIISLINFALLFNR